MQTNSLKPLSGLRILVTRPEDQARTISHKLRELGATPLELPMIQIVKLEHTTELDRAVARLADYDWVIFTSVHGVKFFSERMIALNVAPEDLTSRCVATIGPATAAALRGIGKKPDYIPDEYLSERIAAGLGDIHGKRILLPRADLASKELPAVLQERGAIVDDVVAYRTAIPKGLTAEKIKSIFSEGVDWVTFTSPSTVHNFAQVIGDKEVARFLRGAKIACIGPVTSQAAERRGIGVNVIAETHTVDALVEGIVNEIRAT